MTLTELDRDSGNGAVAVPDGSAPSPKPRRRRWPWVVGGAGIVVAVLVVLAVLAAAYQPLQPGGASGGTVPALGAVAVGRYVTNFAGPEGGYGYYIPPRRAAFTMVEGFENAGSRAVTIEAVSFVPPSQVNPSPLESAGQALYIPGSYTRGEKPWTVGRPVRGVSLGPSEAITVGIPARIAGACYVPHSFVTIDVFYVQERFLTFTQWVALPLRTPLVMREPEPRGGGSVLICPR